MCELICHGSLRQGKAAQCDTAGTFYEAGRQSFASQSKAHIAVAEIAKYVHGKDIPVLSGAHTYEDDGVRDDEDHHPCASFEERHLDSLGVIALPLPIGVK